jgi:ketosteroid isomerase-like protein
MKLLTSLFALIALGTMASAFAQEEQTPAASPEEKASPAVQESPAPTPAATAAAAKSPSVTVEQSASPAEAKKGASPAAAKSAAPAPAISGKKMSMDAALRDSENRWEAAVAKHDVATVQSMVANDFVGVSSKGKFVNKSGLLSEFKGDKDTYTSGVNEKLNVKAFGPNIAVVTGRAREKGTSKDGKTFDRAFLFTDTWMERNGQWQCIASQAMELPRR